MASFAILLIGAGSQKSIGKRGKINKERPLEGMSIELKSDGLCVRTSGLTVINHPELTAHVRDQSLMPDCLAFLQFVTEYITTQNRRIDAGKTLAYGYWATKFIATDKGELAVW